MTKTGRVTLAVLGSMLALAGCASNTGLDDAGKLALYRAHAGEPASSFAFFGRLNGWAPLGDSALAVWTRPGEAWLLELYGPCQDLDFALSIGLTSTISRVHARFDKVIVNRTGSFNVPCPIREIRPLDVKALRTSEKDLRDARVQERDAAGTD